ncbi:uncharacterized protein EV420DRAFT_1645344 [Desarmillaria tabescens]|uniref:Uncharacterized protein n=1 Tax=Armillaria tabescens TaxID=1929756 RepID=A0AA39N1V4_ARMTA|nr:uncharacterized protein EV420DRAFT_1645344 [Desarmillaria tabescens]KAK0454115.1 hypothetical protein EV420DRAFT_1645344 [Desarmillaria tabescens]
MQSLNASQEVDFSTREKFYAMDDSPLDLLYTNTEPGERVYVDFASRFKDTPPELLYLCAIVQAMTVVSSSEYWYMLEHAVLSPRGELFFQYAVYTSLSNPYDSLPVCTSSFESDSWAIVKFIFPFDIGNVESLKQCALDLQTLAKNGSLSQLRTYLEPASQQTMINVHREGQKNSEDLHPAYTTDLAAECVSRGMWGLVEVISDGTGVDASTQDEVVGTIGYYCPRYGLVSAVKRDEKTKQTYYREIIRWVKEDTEEEDSSEDEED